MKSIRIVCSAIMWKFKNSDEFDFNIWAGLSHADIITQFSFLKIQVSDRDMEFEIQGFLDSEGRFLDRKEAYIVAENANQIRDARDDKTLFSENIVNT